MLDFLLRYKIVAAIITIGLLLILIFQGGFYKPTPPTVPSTQGVNSDSPKIISTNPPALDGSVITPSQAIEITFNKPLVNDPARVVLEPEHEVKIELSSDHRTMKIIPLKPFTLGSGYVLTIKKDYGFDTQEKLPDDVIFHFRTIYYTGV